MAVPGANVATAVPLVLAHADLHRVAHALLLDGQIHHGLVQDGEVWWLGSGVYDGDSEQARLLDAHTHAEVPDRVR
jgi:hypothetical protein